LRKSNPPRTPPPAPRETGRFPRPKTRTGAKPTVEAAPRARGTNPVPHGGLEDVQARPTTPAVDPVFSKRRVPAQVGAAREVVRPNRLFKRLVAAIGLEEAEVMALLDLTLAREDATPATINASQMLFLERELRSATMNKLPARDRVAASSRLDELFASLR
jgi:hypothetical protein